MQAVMKIEAVGEVRDADGHLKETFPVEVTQLVEVADDGTITPITSQED